MRQVMNSAIAAIEPSLSAQQKQLLQQLRAGAQLRGQEPRNSIVVWVLRAGQTKPTPAPVETGIADNAYTLV